MLQMESYDQAKSDFDTSSTHCTTKTGRIWCCKWLLRKSILPTCASYAVERRRYWSSGKMSVGVNVMICLGVFWSGSMLLIAPPYNSELEAGEGTFECPYGEIAVGFKRGKDRIVVLKLTVPMSTTATLLLPDSSSRAQVTRLGGNVGSRAETGSSLTLRHGKYSVRIT